MYIPAEVLRSIANWVENCEIDVSSIGMGDSPDSVLITHWVLESFEYKLLTFELSLKEIKDCNKYGEVSVVDQS